MMRRRLIFLLLSACLSICRLQTDDFVSQFTVVRQPMNWTSARSYCRAKFMDLATIPDDASSSAAQQAVGKREGLFWIGLFNTSWRWSQGNEDVSPNVSYTSWAPGQPTTGSCATISDSGLWSVRDCAVLHWFLCYNAASNSHVLVQTPMNWTDARVYCRSTFTDMSSIQTAKNNSQVSGLLQVRYLVLTPLTFSNAVTADNGQTTTSTTASHTEAWIGLYRFTWGWSDRSTSTYTRWGPNQPSGPMNCAVMDTLSTYWFSRPCEDSFPFLCYAGKTTSEVKMVKLRLRRGSADLKDPVLQDSILQQLQQKLQDGGVGEVKLSWRKQPEEEEQEKERPPPCGRDQDYV